MKLECAKKEKDNVNNNDGKSEQGEKKSKEIPPATSEAVLAADTVAAVVLAEAGKINRIVALIVMENI